MNKSDYRWFYEENFIDENLRQLLIQNNQFINKGLFIEEDGFIKNSEPFINNRCFDNKILKDNLIDPVKVFIEKLENKLLDNGVFKPVLYTAAILVNPNPNPIYRSYPWHKDFNTIKHTTDPKKLWFTFFSLNTSNANSEFMISPNADGPGLWNMGVKKVLKDNQIFGHNMNFGHQYFTKTNNDVQLIYIRWFDAG